MLSARSLALGAVTALVAVLSLWGPLRARRWVELALAGGTLLVGYVLAYMMVVQGRELVSPIRLIERMTHAIISLFSR
jgi:hypothetical protein